MRIEDISPRDDNTVIVFERRDQSVSGRALCCAMSADSTRAYLGGHSGVWRSDNGGLSWWHPERPQPPPGQTSVPGALLALNVYDLLISPSSSDVVLAATGRAARRPNPSGIYRSTDGAQSWNLVHTFTGDPVVGPAPAAIPDFGAGGPVSEPVGCLAVAPDDPRLMYAAGGSCVARSRDGGATWTDLTSSRAFASLWYIVVGPRQGPSRRVYAVGSKVIYSLDGGDSWQADPMPISLGPPGDALGESSRAVGIHPRNPAIVYVIVVTSRGEGEEDLRILWRGQFPSLPSNQPGAWTQLSVPGTDFPGTTPSGGAFIIPHVTGDGALYLILSDRRTAHVAEGEPASQDAWHRIEDKKCHLDPHGFAFTPNFRPHLPGRPQPGAARALLVNDGGANVSVDGGRSWINGVGLSTLDVVNVAVNVRRGKPVAICIGTGDNRGFSSRDGGANWKTQHYDGGDNDCCFADPLQPERLIVFSPREGPKEGPKKGCFLYTGSGGNPPNADSGTQQARAMEGPAFLGGPPLRERGHNLVSNFCTAGYRPLVLTLDGEARRADGDLVLIRFTPARALLLRTTRMSEITSPTHWVTVATSESQSALTFRQGPTLPNMNVCTVQASGGHETPTYYVGDQLTGSGLWKWTEGMAAWRQIVPGSGAAGAPAAARRYFADPYRPSLVYVLDQDHIWRSDDGGTSWVADSALELAMTENGAFPFGIGNPDIVDGTPAPMLLSDMKFDPFRPGCRFAVGPAGVFHTQDGRSWSTLLRASAMAVHPVNAVYDPISCERALYVATYGRGLLRLAPIPPDWDYPADSLQTAIGRITLLRVHDARTGFGPPHDRLDAEVIVLLDSEPEKAFGIKLRPGADMRNAEAMLDLLRDAFRRNTVVRLEFFRSGCRTGKIHRIIETQ